MNECKPLLRGSSRARLERIAARQRGQGLTRIHFSAQLEPCLSQENTLHTLHTPLIRATQPPRATPFPYKALKLS